MRIKTITGLFFLFVVIYGIGCGKKSSDEYTISDAFHAKMEHVNTVFNENRYDSVEVLLLQLKNETNSAREKYLIYCYQAELMYYNMLPELAYTNLDAAMEIAQQSGKPELIANCENYYGLFNIIEKKPAEAQKHFYQANALFPSDSTFEFLVNQYQIFSNLAETHLILQNPDSAIYYTQKSFAITQKEKIQRGSALNYWSFGKANIQKGFISEAEVQFKKGLQAIQGKENDDVLHYLYAGLVEAAIKKNDPESAFYWIQLGNDSTMKNSSVLAQTDFYEQAVKAASVFNLKDLSIELDKKQLQFVNTVREKELVMQSKVLSNYFEELGFVKQKDREKQLTNRFIQGTLIAMMLVLMFIIYVNRKILRQKIKINELETKSKIAILTKEKELSEIIARNNAIEEERTRISKELHDDIGSSISSIKIYNNLAQKQLTESPEKTKELLDKSSTEIKQIEESLGDLIWAVYTKNETIQNLIMRMKQYAFDVLTAKDIHADFNYPYQLNETKLPIEFRKNILLIFKEFVNNTAKYSGAKNFHFSISLVSDKNILVKMSDDGVGFDTDAHTGKGLSNMQSRAKEMGVDFKLSSSPGKGAVLEINYGLTT